VLKKNRSVENAAEYKSEIYTGKLKIPNNTTSGTAVVQWWYTGAAAVQQLLELPFGV